LLLFLHGNVHKHHSSLTLRLILYFCYFDCWRVSSLKGRYFYCLYSKKSKGCWVLICQGK